jgi:hypothetical protein
LSNKILLIIICSISLTYFSNAYAQAEKSAIYNDFIKINESAKKIKDAKIQKCTEVVINGDKEDTIKAYSYDKTGNLTQQLTISLDTNKYGKKLGAVNTSFVYDKDGHLAQKIDTLGKAIIKTTLFYDDIENITRLEENNVAGNLLKEISYDNDELSRLTESTEINYMNNCKTVTHYSYDSYNNITKLSVKNSCQDLGDKTTVTSFGYKYDKKYNIIEKISKYPVGATKSETFKYDAKGNITEAKESTGSEQYDEYVYTYDNSNNRIKVETKEISGDKTYNSTQELKYDKFGNLLEVQSQDKSGDLTFKFVFEYYN